MAYWRLAWPVFRLRLQFPRVVEDERRLVTDPEVGVVPQVKADKHFPPRIGNRLSISAGVSNLKCNEVYPVWVCLRNGRG